MFKTHKAFTLIELLVVIAIIGILASVVVVNVGSSRLKARDGKRKADLKSIQTALELYFDKNGSYPISCASGTNWCSSEPDNSWPNNSGNWIPGLTPEFMSALPRDPKGGAPSPIVLPQGVCNGAKSAYLYLSNPTGSEYKVLAHCSPETGFSSSDAFYDPGRPSHAWQVSSPGYRNI